MGLIYCCCSHSVSELLKAKEDLTAERDAKLQEIASLREKLSASQESEQKTERERDEAQSKLQEVSLHFLASNFYGRRRQGHCIFYRCNLLFYFYLVSIDEISHGISTKLGP